jgi:hypothetical protein
MPTITPTEYLRDFLGGRVPALHPAAHEPVARELLRARRLIFRLKQLQIDDSELAACLAAYEDHTLSPVLGEVMYE